VGWQQQQQSFNSFTVRAGAPAAGFNSPSTAAWSSPGPVSAVPQGQYGSFSVGNKINYLLQRILKDN